MLRITQNTLIEALVVRDLNQILEQSGDVTIGAYARRNRQRRILVGITGGCLILGALVVYVFVTGLGQPGVAQPTVMLQCKQCQHTLELVADAQRSYPTPCTKCQAQAVWPQWQCRYCNHEFLPSKLGEGIHCPMCDSTNVGHRQMGSSGAP